MPLRLGTTEASFKRSFQRVGSRKGDNSSLVSDELEWLEGELSTKHSQYICKLVLRNPFLTGTIYGVLLVAGYFLVIALSSPTLSPATSLQLSLQLNWALFILLPTTFGVMMGMRRWLHNQPACSLKRGEALGGPASILSTFFSLFSLTSVGCCALLASWVSILLGTSVVVSLVEFSLPLTLSSFAGMILAIVWMVRTGLRRRNLNDST